MSRTLFTSWGSQLVRSGQGIGGRTGMVIQWIGAFVGLAVGLFWLFLLTLVASILIGDIAWLVFAGFVVFLGHRAVQTYRAQQEDVNL